MVAALAVGVHAGLLDFLPSVGPLLSGFPGVGMGFAVCPVLGGIGGGGYWGIQFLENHILIPLLMKGGMDLPPALTVITQALLALVFGVLGLMVAVPLLATVMVMVQVLYVEQRQVGADTHTESRSDDFDPELDEGLEGAPAA